MAANCLWQCQREAKDHFCCHCFSPVKRDAFLTSKGVNELLLSSEFCIWKQSIHCHLPCKVLRVDKMQYKTKFCLLLSCEIPSCEIFALNDNPVRLPFIRLLFLNLISGVSCPEICGTCSRCQNTALYLGYTLTKVDY